MFEALFSRNRAGRISPDEAKKRLDSGEKIILLDVRTPEEYREVHIPHSVLLPLDRLQNGIGSIAPEKDAEIFVYCLSGVRAARACRQLATLGYTHVSSLGGLQNWNYETERGRQS